jgi:hypothetical protein
MDFTRISKTHILFEIHFCDQAPDSFDSSRRYPRFTQNTPRRRREMQLGPRAMGVAVPAKIPARSSPGRVGEGWRMVRGLPRAGLWSRLGRRGA